MFIRNCLRVGAFFLCLILFVNCSDTGFSSNEATSLSSTADATYTQTSMEENSPPVILEDGLSIVYFDGGWYGPKPNYRMNLSIKIEANKVKAELTTPDCRISGELPTLDIQYLVEQIEVSKSKDPTLSVIDGGVETIALVTSDTNIKYNLKHFSPLMDPDDAAMVRQNINGLAKIMMIQEGCGLPDN